MDRGAAEGIGLIELGGRAIEYRFVRRRRRTLGITVDARYPSADARLDCDGSITRAASGRIISFTRASMKFLKKIFFVPFSW